MAGWLTIFDVKAELGLDPADVYDDVWLARVTAASQAYVETIPAYARALARTDPPADPATFTPPEPIVTGALMLAARWYRRRNSPEGLASYGDLGATTVPPLDRDIERQLELGKFARPAVG